MILILPIFYPPRQNSKDRPYAALLAAAALSPILMAALTQAYVSKIFPDLPWGWGSNCNSDGARFDHFA
jgi:hypothetical protein